MGRASRARAGLEVRTKCSRRMPATSGILSRWPTRASYESPITTADSHGASPAPLSSGRGRPVRTAQSTSSGEPSHAEVAVSASERAMLRGELRAGILRQPPGRRRGGQRFAVRLAEHYLAVRTVRRCSHPRAPRGDAQGRGAGGCRALSRRHPPNHDVVRVAEAAGAAGEAARAVAVLERALDRRSGQPCRRARAPRRGR